MFVHAAAVVAVLGFVILLNDVRGVEGAAFAAEVFFGDGGVVAGVGFFPGVGLWGGFFWGGEGE